MKKKILIGCIVIIALLIGSLCWYQNTYIQIESEPLRRDIRSLTLTGDDLPDEALLQQLTALEELDVRNLEISIDTYEQLKSTLPHCRILWNIPFQGSYYSQDTAELTVTSLTAEDMAAIAYFSNLKTVHADGCRDYDALIALQQSYPHLNVHYTVTIGGAEYPQDTPSLTIENADVSELRAAIEYLPQLCEVTFTGTAPDNDTIYQMMCDFPQVAFYWNLTLFGIETQNTATELNLSGIPMENTEKIESYLKYFPNLQRVDMCDCGIPSADMDALSQRWPEIRFIWTVRVGRGTLRTDAVGFIPWKFGYSAAFPLFDKDCTELKYCIDMVCLDLGHMKISDLSFLEYMPKLKYLIVGELPCPDFSPITYCQELIYLEIFNVTFPHQEILLDLPNLQDLNMGSTKVYGTEVLKQMTWLKRLWLAGTGLTFAEYDELVAALPDTQVVMHIPHSTAGGWRQHQNYYDMRDLLGMFYME